MNKQIALVGMFAAVGALSLAGKSYAYTETHTLNRDVALQIPLPGDSFTLNHTWAESQGDASCPNDMTQSRRAPGSPNIYCQNRSDNTGCSKARDQSLFKHAWPVGYTCSLVPATLGNCYANANTGNYAFNGVCHQATNRAFSQTPVPFMRDISWIAGGTASAKAYFDYGATAPFVGAWGRGC